MKQITSEMFQNDDGTIKETTREEIFSKIIELSKNDPFERTLAQNRANLMLIRRFVRKLEKTV